MAGGTGSTVLVQTFVVIVRCRFSGRFCNTGLHLYLRFVRTKKKITEIKEGKRRKTQNRKVLQKGDNTGWLSYA